MRSAKMDNLKFLLMTLVVLGHLLELQEGAMTDYVYLIIYSFHMPLFVWVSGYFAKPADERTLRTLVLPYLVFQILYQIFAVYLWGTQEVIELLGPYWLMWYIMALFLWRLLLPLVDRKDLKGQLVCLGAATAISLLAGWENELRFVLAFQRMTALFPAFLFGYYCHGRRGEITSWWGGLTKKQRTLISIGVVAAVLCGFALVVIFRGSLYKRWFYWTHTYSKTGGNVLIRLGLLVFAAVCLGAAMIFLPDRRIPLVTRIGRSTLPVYLLHGFVIKTLEWLNVYDHVKFPWLLTIGLLAAMMLLFSSPPVARLFDWCFGHGTTARKRLP